MVEFMEGLPNRLKTPDAIVVISAHWEEATATLTGAENPPMLYDYYGFPEEAYQIQYPAPGDPGLAGSIASALSANGIQASVDTERGFDHGLYIPLKLMYPDTNIPSIQLSLVRGLDPVTHLELGKTLRTLSGNNILIIGSGFSFHNMRAFSWDGESGADPRNDAFQDWLIEVCTIPMPSSDREQKLLSWESAPSARYCHPREEHLLPLHVCAGMAEGQAELIFDDYILGKRSVAFLW
jgi:aromatic ring-opening dioxygenase catalytic subunit (LigB family)